MSKALRSITQLAVLLLLSVPSPIGAAQDEHRIIIPDDVSCPNCRIEFEHIARLGGQTESTGLVCGGLSNVAVTPARYYVQACRRAEVLVLDRAGNLVDRIGSQGEGPGEFQPGPLTLLPMPDGGLLVFSQGRVATRFTPDLEIERAYRRGGDPIDVAVMTDGTTVQAYLGRTGDLIGYPLHVVDPSGNYVRSIGEDPEAVVDIREPETLVRKVGKDRTGTKVWSARFNEYRMELLDLEGNVERVITRASSWFEPWNSIAAGAPTFGDLNQDEAGVLWTVLDRPGFEPTPGGPSGYRFVIEAIDIEAGALLASRVLNLHDTLPRFAGNYVWQTVHDGDQEWIEVSRLRIVR